MSSPPIPVSFLLDSNVVVKWYHEEEDTLTALHLREGYLEGRWDIRLADLSFYELANTLHYSEKYSPSQITERVQSLLAMELQVYGFQPAVLRTALDLCADKRIAIYDAYLVALAKHENLMFVTSDRKLLRKLAGEDSAMALQELAI